MSDVKPLTNRRYLSAEDEDSLARGDSTSTIVKRDAKIAVDIHGADPTWRQVKTEQQSARQNLGCLAGHTALALVDGAHFAEFAVLESSATTLALSSLATPLGALVAFGLGAHELHEAHEKAGEQAAALARDNAHVAILGALDLPAAYKAQRLDVDYKGVSRGPSSPAFKMTEAIMADTRGRATLQARADRGIQAARDFGPSGMTKEDFFASRPKVAQAYRDDAAFREGFDAYVFAQRKLPAVALGDIERAVEARNGWSARREVQIPL